MNSNEFGAIRERLEALTFFRVIAVTLFLGGAIFFDVRSISSLSEARSTAFLSLIVGTYLLTIVYAMVIRQIEDPRPLAMVQVGLDVIIVTALVIITGGLSSIFVFVFHINVVSAATVGGRSAGYTVAVAATLAMGIFAAADVGALSSFFPLIQVSVRDPASIWFQAASNSAAALALAFLAGYLSDRVGEIRTELGEREQAVQELRVMNEHILNGMSSGVISIGTDGNVIFFNRAAESMTGVAQQDALTRPLDVLIPEMAAQIDSVFTGEYDRDGQTRNQCGFDRHGEQRLFGYSVSDLQVAEVPQGKIIIFQDLTDVRQLESKMRRAERLASVGQLAASIAHEIRNPLASISGSVEMLFPHDGVEDERGALRDIIIREVDRLNGLITEFLDYSRPREVHLKKIVLQDVLDELVPLALQLELEIHESDQLTVGFLGDVESVNQIFWNLFRNAKDVGASSVWISTKQVGTSVRIFVDDNGPGISRDNLPHVFEPFFTTRPDGTGLGLATIYKLMEEHGGDIVAKNRPDGGARFELSFKAAE